jgi:hypothetical protein
VERAVELGISVLAVTDHNSVEDIPHFRQAAKEADVSNGRLHIFPGFEIASSEGVHLLCIYDPSTSTEQLERFLGEFGITRPESSEELSCKTFGEALALVRRQKGVAIAAHVTQRKGLLTTLSDKACSAAWANEGLLAVQIPGAVEDLPPNWRRIVRNQDPAYRRKGAPERDLALAVVNARDVVEADDLEDPWATCWIKMSEVGIEALRQAFLDPRSRIRLNSRQPLEAHAELVAVSWEGGFLDGVGVHFNPNLNVLIGGRGAGKSTVIESIRAVLGSEPLTEDAARNHRGIVRNVLRDGTKISLVVRIPRPAPREYLIERTLPNPPLVRERGGAASGLTPRDLLPGLEIFGQREIAELTRHPERLARLLDRFGARDEQLAQQKSELLRELQRNRRRLLDMQHEIEETETRLAHLPGLLETLRRYEECGLEQRFKERTQIIHEGRILQLAEQQLHALRESLETLNAALPLDRSFVSARALADLPGRDILRPLDGILSRLDAEVHSAAKKLQQALEEADQEIGKVRLAWDARKQEVEQAYLQTLRKLQKTRSDAEDFIKLKEEIESLRPLREALESARKVQRTLEARRRQLLEEWEEVKAEEIRRLEKAARKVNRVLANLVRVEVRAGRNREPLIEILRREIGGRLAETMEAIRRAAELSIPRFVAACRQGSDAIAKIIRIPAAQARQLAALPSSALLVMEELDLPAEATIWLNVASEGESPRWKELKDLSTGQKATAVLLLILLESTEPLIVDQPEDDLDNRFITEGIVPRVREEKQRRQFIFSTHNANIPVLGDAELILGLSASGEAEGQARIPPDHRGSIDAAGVRRLVEEVLEGGREAFERRRRKYGF